MSQFERFFAKIENEIPILILIWIVFKHCVVLC